MRKPIIGIITKHYARKQLRPDVYIRDEVKQAVFDNGGIAIGIIPPDKDVKYIGNNWENNLNEIEYRNLIEQIKLCDGIIFQGGGKSDNYECIVAKYCFDNNIPTLGICCGQNIMVRALGGTIKPIENIEKHNQIEEEYVHDILIDRTSKLYEIIKKDKIMVNSRHKKTVEECLFLDKVAFSEDSCIEAVESKEKKFYMAFRFHPESLYEKDENMNNIFKEFLNCCKKI